MVKGIGVDIVEIHRMGRVIQKYPRLLSRLFTLQEQEYCQSRLRPHLHFAARFAAKEAVLKALGTGLRGIKWTDLEVCRDSFGKPFVRLKGKAASIAEEKGVSDILISLSFSQESAIAFALAMGGGEDTCTS
ncbi:MAG: holo-ACP synthase [Actinomycetota bacterium]|nr:holo-ACP synthase [Actinomycetota bacterium]MDI6822393.1 holo-ACP synthase [Actinomycetota bacterium]